MRLRTYEEGLHRRLRDPEYAAGFLSLAYEDGGVEELLEALKDVAAAQQGGLKEVADAASRSRVSLIRALRRSSNPTVKTLDDVLAALGLSLAITPKARRGQATETPLDPSVPA